MNDSLPFSPYYKLRVLQIGLIKQQLSLSLSCPFLHSLALFFALVFSPSFSLDVAATNSVKMTNGAQRRRFAKQFPEGVSRAKLRAIAEAEGFRRIIRQANYEVRNKRRL